jgi:hypothetical protein
MESTSVYWIPIFELHRGARGFTVFLVNARDAKHVPGRKTDVSDAQWLQRLHSHACPLNCEPTRASASVCSSTRPRASSTCKRR